MSLPISDSTDTVEEVKVEKKTSQLSTDQFTDSSPLSSPPSSPPVLKVEHSQNTMPSPTEKRSHEDMGADSEEVISSSITEEGDVDRSASQSNPNPSKIDSTPTNTPFSTAQTTLPPAKADATSMPPPSKRPLQNGNGSHKSKAQSGQNQKATQKAAPTATEDLDAGTGIEEETRNDDELSDPSLSGEANEQIEDFDWFDLEGRYHDKMAKLGKEQEKIIAEFNELCQYFGAWAEAGSLREIDRSHKRLKTQMTLVQHHEDEVEKKRLHYVKVVDAFKSALQLLST